MTDLTKPTLPTGRYRHYKGKDYEVLDLVRHSETEEWLVLYRTLYGDFGLWVRPYAMFVELIEIDGVQQPRFARIA
ncbi:MAG TPA: DUF1653 domain-containing protein [Chitinolyticbacter sp.]|nr:DUF1653 domain-containing protein [Chitinolyticbacter sp.]